MCFCVCIREKDESLRDEDGLRMENIKIHRDKAKRPPRPTARQTSTLKPKGPLPGSNLYIHIF